MKTTLVDALLFRRQDFVEAEDLLDDLAGGEIAFDAIDAAGAEFTSDGTSDLGTDAGGSARAVGDHDGFGVGAGLPTQQEFLRFVAALLADGDGGFGKKNSLLESF